MYPKDPKLLVRANRRLSKRLVLTSPDKLAVETKFKRLGVETNPGVRRVAVDTKLRRFAVLTWFKRLGVDTKLRRF